MMSTLAFLSGDAVVVDDIDQYEYGEADDDGLVDFAAESAAVCALPTITSFASMVLTTASPVNLPATDNVAPDPRHELASPAKSVAMDLAAKLCLL